MELFILLRSLNVAVFVESDEQPFFALQSCATIGEVIFDAVQACTC